MHKAVNILDFGQVYKSEFNYKQLFFNNSFKDVDFIVGDIEAYLDDKNNFVFEIGVIFDGKDFRVYNTVEDYYYGLLCHKTKIVYFHNLNFDILFFLEKIFFGVDVRMVQSGNMILSIKIDKIEFRNSLSILNGSLKKVVNKFLGIDWKDWENQKDDIFGLSKDELINYCNRDCYLTFLAVYKFKNFVKQKWGVNNFLTIPSLALKIFNNKYIKDCKDDFFGYNKASSFFEEGYYFGGHTEKYVENIYKFREVDYIDVNSLYPYIMRDIEIGDGYYDYIRPTFINLEMLYKKECIFFIECLLMVDSEDMRIFVSNENLSNWYKFGLQKVKISYLSYQFLKDINKEKNIFKINKLVYNNGKKHKIFNDFVTDFYGYRVKYKDYEFIIKLILNALYGKYGQKRTIDRFTINGDLIMSDRVIGQGVNVICVKEEELNERSQIFCRKDIAGLITEKARLYMRKNKMMLEKRGHKILYQDTDSLMIVSNCKSECYDDIMDNKELGKFKKENVNKMNGYIIGQKIYGFDDGHKASKGVKNMKFNDYKRLALYMIIVKIMGGEIKINWIECEKSIYNLHYYPNNRFYNTRFTQLKTFLKNGYFGVAVVPHYINNIRERLD